MPDLLRHVAELDSVLRSHNQADNGTDSDRRRIRDAIQAMADLADPDLTLTETISLAVTSCRSEAKRTLAAVMIRLVSGSGPLTERDMQKCRREIVTFVEDVCPDLTKALFEPNDQNHEKIEAIKRIHYTACEHLDHLRQPFASLQDLAKRRQTIMRSINHRKSKNYLNAFGYSSVHQLVESLLSQVESATQARGNELQTTIQQLIEDIPIQMENCERIGTFVTTQYAVPFLEHLKKSAATMKERLAADFTCHISIPHAARTADKRYPLHLVGSAIEILVPLNNDGPGVAQSVTTYCVVDHGEVKNAEIKLGSVNPGPFVVTLLIELTEVQTELQATVEVSWSVVGDPKRHSDTFTTHIRGQRTDIDWEKLTLQHPYSLEVAYDDDFYGRRDVLNRIVRRLTSNAMQSCYITGQKRVGKSSLARAVQARIEKTDGLESYHVLYLECGEIMHTTGEATLAELGRRLDDFFVFYLDRHTAWNQQNYSSSLSPLNRLLDTLRRENGLNRFVVILDEFDEINESLYSHGELASTFFVNLRTLASRRNLAFVLVGAEKMPYLMSSQGEKLNKFDRESLDSFNQNTEWSDFTSLVRDPVVESIVFHDSALRRLYDLTDGHPYFAKVVCAKAYELALGAKDAEISTVDVRKAGLQLLVSLDTNAFAHYWRDGTRGGANEVEIASVKRCRTLVSWARTVRSGAQPTRDEIDRHVYAHLRVDEMGHELDDFCRRGVFKEKEGEYVPKVELFGRWLREGGFTRLVDGHVGDELEEMRQIEEDKAYVRSDEVVDLVGNWPLYQGHRITEDRVRAWINQEESNVARRLLFKLLQKVRFVTDEHVHEAFHGAFNKISRRLPPFVQRKRTQRRSDVLVTYLGGAAKSGAHYASQFAEANRITQGNVVAPEQLGAAFGHGQEDRIAAVVIVDDMIGTGNTLASDLDSWSGNLNQLEIGSTAPLFICVFCATVEGEAKVRRYLHSTFQDSDLDVCEVLDKHHFAFAEGLAFWSSKSEKERAKSMVMNLGARVDKRRPLGYRGQGLLLTFSRNCPNNSLPILYGTGKGSARWTPLFPRLQL